MTSYKELQAQIAKLQKQAEEARQNEIIGAIAEIKIKMQEYGITAADLEITGKRKATTKTRAMVDAKYRDDSTGQTWTGRGREPKWIAGKDRNQFLIK